MINKRKTPKIAVGALIACQIGTVSSTASAGLFSMIGKFLQYPTRILRTQPSMILPFIPHITNLVTSIPSFAKKTFNSVMDFLEEQGKYLDEGSIERNIEEAFEDTGIEKFKEVHKNLLRAVLRIVRGKKIRDKGDVERKKTNFILFSGVKTPIREKLVSDVCSSFYSKDFLSLDLTGYNDPRSALLPETKSSSLWMRSSMEDDDDNESTSENPGNKLKKYIEKKNDCGVVKIKLNSKALKALDPIFAELSKPSANGTANVRKGSELKTGNLTFILELEDDDVRKDMEFLRKSEHIKFPKEMENIELEDLVGNIFEKSFNYYTEEFGCKASFDIFVRSICAVLKKNQNVANEEKMLDLVEDFKNFFEENIEKLEGQEGLDIIYDAKKGGFSIVGAHEKVGPPPKNR